nr:MAG TPA: hypothetical protein [Caudoviricetes sp.]
MGDLVHIENIDISIKEYNGHRVVTFKDVDLVHNRPEGTARKRFNDNKKHFIEGEDFFVRKTDEAAKDYGIVAPNGLVLLTEQGYLMLVKSFTDDLAWKVQRQLVNSYFRVRHIVDDRLSPETKMLFTMINQIAESELQAKQAKELAQKAIETTESIKEAVMPIFDNWREETNEKFNRIQKNAEMPFKDLRTEMYAELERRAGCDLSVRLRNKRSRMMENGCTKTEINNLNKMDIIEGDKKLREIFSKIVSEYEIKFCA